MSQVSDRLIRCPHCGNYNRLKSDLIGTDCSNCGKAVLTPEFEAELASKPMTLRSTVDRTGDVLRVMCPHCGHANEFPELEMVSTFRCQKCDQPVEAVEPVQ